MSEWSVRHHETVKEFAVILNSHMKTAPSSKEQRPQNLGLTHRHHAHPLQPDNETKLEGESKFV